MNMFDELKRQLLEEIGTEEKISLPKFNILAQKFGLKKVVLEKTELNLITKEERRLGRS